MEGMKEKFYKIFEKRMEGKGANNQLFTKERYEQLVSDINDIFVEKRRREIIPYQNGTTLCK